MRAGKVNRTWRVGGLALLLWVGAVVSPVNAAITCSAPSADRAAYWTATLDATDALGCHDGILVNGAAFALGRVGTAFSLDGTDDYVSVPDHSLWALGTSNFAISFWFNLASPCNPCFFLGADEGGGPQNKWIVFLSGGNLSLHINFDGGIGANIVSGPFAPSTGEWYQVAVTRTGNQFALLVNGELLAAQTSSVVIPDPSASLTIGQVENAGYVHGLMDEIEIAKGL